MNRIVIVIVAFPWMIGAQSYPPEPGQPGSTAIHKDSSVFAAWATGLTVQRGYLNITNPSLGIATYGNEADAVGQADGTSVVSLGDSGIALITFAYPIWNGPGPDFAVFENGFIDHYMEFAFVEVSSDGVSFVRFEAVSEIPADVQLDNFSTSNCAYVNNLAGKYRAEYGTPFDLEELSGNPLIDINNIQYVRLIDVIGSIDTLIGSFDSQANIINDPFPTEFPSGGFDLDAVGVIHAVLSLHAEGEDPIQVYPNPVSDKLFIGYNEPVQYELCTSDGRLAKSGTATTIDVSDLTEGIYYFRLKRAGRYFFQKIVISK